MARGTETPTRFSSFIEATEVEEEKEFVWGAMAELEEEREEVGGLAMTRAQERKEVGKGVDKRGEIGDRLANRRGKEKTEEAWQPAYWREPQIANAEAPQQALQQILEVKVPNIKV